MTRRLWLTCVLLFFSSAAFAQASLISPNVSADGLFLYRNSNFAKENTNLVRNGVDLQEAELGFYADVDPYTRFTILLSIAPVYQLDGNNRVVETWSVEPEEAYAETNQVPLTTIRVGKFKAAFGKHNLLHTHAYPFTDAPLANSALLGDEGLDDVGVSAAVLLPVGWFSEFTAQYLRGEGENQEFNSPTPSDAVGLGHWKNLWDLTEDLTLEAGASYAQGTNFLGGTTTLTGGDLTFKWRPAAGGKSKSAILASEYIGRSLEQPGTTTQRGDGWNVWGQYQFAERWSALARYDHLGVTGSNLTVNPNGIVNVDAKKYSASIVFKATEFSSYRLEYDQAEGPKSMTGDTVEHKVYLQANFVIGAHPAHAY
jgi:hypothetical protein